VNSEEQNIHAVLFTTYVCNLFYYIREEYKDPYKVYLRDMGENVEKFRTYCRERKVINTKTSHAVKSNVPIYI
jgi:hypothetical protein